MPALPNSQERPVLAAERRARIMMQSAFFWKYTEHGDFPLNLQPCLHSKENLLTEVSELQELQNFCHFVCNSFHSEKGSEISVTRYWERDSFPKKFLCVENKRERKEYALADIAVFKSDLLATCNTDEFWNIFCNCICYQNLNYMRKNSEKVAILGCFRRTLIKQGIASMPFEVQASEN